MKWVRHLLTASEAVRTLGIPMGTIKSWRARGVLCPRGLDERGHAMYDREHLIELREHGRAAVAGRHRR